MTGALRVRKDVTKLSQEELITLVRAFRGIQGKDPNLDTSFFKIAGYHGMPFRGAGWGNSTWWGGYCHHGNILFPTWHRAYLYCLEEALRTVEGCENVTIPYWNELASATQTSSAVVPEIFTSPTFPLDGVDIPNPLYSYTFQKKIVDHLSVDINSANPYDYSKPGKADTYSTVRYPQTGLVGTDKDLAATTVHNKLWGDPVTNAKMLNDNVHTWLTQDTFVNHAGDTVPAGTGKKLISCLNAPNYTVFSNTTSAKEWNGNLASDEQVVVPLESPHNDIHLAVGGFEVPSYDRNVVEGAQGDMGENVIPPPPPPPPPPPLNPNVPQY
jgi:tyrosinase